MTVNREFREPSWNVCFLNIVDKDLVTMMIYIKKY